MGEIFTLSDLEQLICALSGIPDLLGSPHKSQRQYGKKRLDEVTLRIENIMDVDRHFIDIDEDEYHGQFWPEYTQLTRKGEYAEAKKIAEKFCNRIVKEKLAAQKFYSKSAQDIDG